MTVRTTGISMNPEISSTRSTSSRAEAMPIAVAFLVLVFGFSGIAQAATIPFSYIINGGSLTTGLPPTLSETFTGSGVVTPFGVATYSDSGTLTVGQFSPGVFGPMVLDVTYVLSFNGGVDTFFGGEVVSFSAPDMNGVQASTATMTILGGTGIFKQATGSGIGSAKSSPLPPTGPAPVTIQAADKSPLPG